MDSVKAWAMSAMQVDVRKKLIAEFLGTYMLVFTVGCNVLASKRDTSEGVYAVISIGSSLMVTIYALGPVSGANFNPAVTMAVCSSGSMGWGLGGMYMIVQFLAGIIASLSFWALYGQGIPFGPNQGSLFSWYQVLLSEFLYTFMLTFTVLSTACIKEGNQYFGMAIGFVIVAAGNAAGWISGGAFNPAVGLGLDVSEFKSGFGWCLPYIMIQMIAGAVSAYAFKFIYAKDFLPSGDRLQEWQELGSKLVAEFIGTFFIVLTVGLNVVQGPAFHDSNPINETAVFSIASAVMVMVYAMGPVSGGHLNPAVTTAVFMSGRNKISPKEAGYYMLSQYFAGIMGACAYAFISGGDTFPLGPYSEFTWLGVFAAEFCFTFLLTFVVLCVATLRSGAGAHTQDQFGLAIGFSVVAGGYAVSAISGAAFNPAVTFGVDMSRSVVDGGFWHWIPYSLFEMMGGYFAAVVFKQVYPEEYPNDGRVELIDEPMSKSEMVSETPKPEEEGHKTEGAEKA